MDIDSIFAPMIAPLTGSILGIGLQDFNDKRQIRQQDKLNRQQLSYNERLADYNKELALEMWHETNYSAQVEELKKAGLNPGLIYGKGGGGGTTTSISGSNSLNAPEAPKGGGEIGMGMQLGLQAMQTQANVKLAEANAKLAEATVPKVSAEVPKTEAETANIKSQTALNQINADIAEIEKQNKPYLMDAEIQNTLENANKLRLENAITQETFDSKVKEIKETAIGVSLNNELTKAKKTLTDTERQGIITGITQKWTELQLQGRSLDQKDTQNQISSFEAEFKAKYPSLMDVIGGALKNGWNSLMNIERTVRGFKPIPLEDTIKK